MKRLLVASLLLAGCARAPQPAPAPVTHPPTYCYKAPSDPGYPVVAQAIHDAFAPYGQAVIEEAGRVACCESGWSTTAVNGPYLSIFQLHRDLYAQTIAFYSVKRFGYASAYAVFDPWVSSQVARDSWVSRRGWGAFSCHP